jgi:hypothetical protein
MSSGLRHRDDFAIGCNLRKGIKQAIVRAARAREYARLSVPVFVCALSDALSCETSEITQKLLSNV